MDNYVQGDLFASCYQKKQLPKHIRLIEFFAGIGAQSKALEILGADFEHWRTAEWSIHSIIAYNAIHIKDWSDHSQGLSYEEVLEKIKGVSSDYNNPMSDKELKRKGEKWARRLYSSMVAIHDFKPNIMDVRAEDLGIKDKESNTYVLTYSFPCFTAGTLVLTDSGYKRIADVNVGDYVLSHDNEYHKVVKTFDNGVHGTLKIKGMGIDEITTTPNHKFYVREMHRKGHFRVRTFDEPSWVEAKDLTKNHYLGVAINRNERISFSNDPTIWWLIGRYIGDGWTRSNAAFICCAKSEREEITSALDKTDYHYSVFDERTTYKIRIASKELHDYLLQFGKGASNKHLTKDIIDLPIDLLKSFIQGYLSADGCKVNDIYKISTTSRELAYGIAQCIAKAYKTPYRIYKIIPPSKKVIEGRTVNQKTWYQVVYKTIAKKQDKAFYEDGYVWFPVTGKTESDPLNVYDIEVENSHSFTANGVIAHNCQDLSNAGQMQGMEKGSGTRSGLLWEVERILNELSLSLSLPQILIMENVPGVCGTQNLKPWNDWLEALQKLGYTSYFKILNAKDYGIPQNRRRCFMVSIQGEASYDFPHPIELRYRLKDFILPHVEKKYYLSDEIVKSFQAFNEKNEEKGNGFKFDPTDGGGGRTQSSPERGKGRATTSSRIGKMKISNETSKAILATQQKDHARDNTYVADKERD